jgi:plasmid stabilization system protein ParE
MVRQYRYYLVTLNLPQIGVRFREAVRLTVQFLQSHPLIGPLCHLKNPRLRELRSWPVAGFEVIRIYYFVDDDSLSVVRILHGKRNVRQVLERERIPGQ